MDPKKRKLLLFVSCALVSVFFSAGALSDILRHGRPADYYIHIPLIPIISAYVLFQRRKLLFWEERGAHPVGVLVLCAGLALLAVDKARHPALIEHVELTVSGAILFLAGSFVALFGRRSFVRARFPFLFLVFMIPLPAAWMERIVAVLVTGATWATQLLFWVFNVPFVREGAVFRLPGFDLQVARECSGIRSSLALLITSVLAGQIFLRARWKKMTLAVAVLPITVLKNAVRIVTLYLLSYFIDIRIIEGGFLHRSGGFVFFGLGLVMLAFALWALKSPRDAWAGLFGVREYGVPKALDKRPSVSDNVAGKESGGFK
ncbi:MAG TPA: exosortase/archaeosortase family protein [Candidatus Aminicenantes bacterium]|nr:exosortase/archaeosortase family protein [Candidatus Aminicenantes bacterium]